MEQNFHARYPFSVILTSVSGKAAKEENFISNVMDCAPCHGWDILYGEKLLYLMMSSQFHVGKRGLKTVVINADVARLVTSQSTVPECHFATFRQDTGKTFFINI